jgi:hypothetical protein
MKAIQSKSKFCLAALVALLLTACGSLDRSSDESKDLSQVEYTVRAMYEGHERVMVISPDGAVAINEQWHDSGRRIVGEITPDERTQLIAAFKDWKTVGQNNAVDVSPQISINYHDWRVTTSNVDKMPEPFRRAKSVLDKIAIAFSVAADAKTAPSTDTAPASQPVIPQ